MLAPRALVVVALAATVVAKRPLTASPDEYRSYLATKVRLLPQCFSTTPNSV
jgi:hypothetical protein